VLRLSLKLASHLKPLAFQKKMMFSSALISCYLCLQFYSESIPSPLDYAPSDPPNRMDQSCESCFLGLFNQTFTNKYTIQWSLEEPGREKQNLSPLSAALEIKMQEEQLRAKNEELFIDYNSGSFSWQKYLLQNQIYQLGIALGNKGKRF